MCAVLTACTIKIIVTFTLVQSRKNTWRREEKSRHKYKKIEGKFKYLRLDGDKHLLEEWSDYSLN